MNKEQIKKDWDNIKYSKQQLDDVMDYNNTGVTCQESFRLKDLIADMKVFIKKYE